MKINILNIKKKLDLPLVGLVLLLISFGELMIYSATYASAPGGDAYYYLKRQLLWFLIGVPAAAAIFFIDLKKWTNYAPFFYAGNCLLLVSVFFFESTLGAQRWIQLGPFSIQPSEFIKLIIVITLSSYFASRKGEVRFRDILVGMLYMLIPLGLILLQPDLGTSLVIIAIFFGVIFIGGADLRHVIALIIAGILLFAFAYQFGVLHDYQKERLTVFLDPESDTKGAGYNLIQSKIAVGSGSFFGTGLFAGSQSDLGFVPISYADFIFSVIGEKLGFFGMLILFVLFFSVLIRTFQISSQARDLFGSLVAGCIAVMWVFQFFVNVGMTIGIMPITGIPLPFVSYGGSSLLTNLVAVGFLLNVSADRFR